MNPPSETRESFFVGGRYVASDDGTRMADQAYVQRRAPIKVQNPYPIVMIHGGGQTAMNFETTPDGRRGWADHFVDEGFAVYLVDQPGRGRSAFLAAAYGTPGSANTTQHVERRFTAPAVFDLWPQARFHTQWPASGQAGDPIFDQFYASQVPGVADPGLREQLMRNAGAALLDRIGPAIILTHSQSGPLGWQIADARPELVKAVVAVEPGGPPFFDVETLGAPEYLRDGALSRPYGITVTPISYDPPVDDPRIDLPMERSAQPDDPWLVAAHLQKAPARRLVNLARIPVLVLTGEASYHASYDHCTVEYLRQAGVEVTHFPLAEKGVRGNGHMMMLELNNIAVAEVINGWLDA